MKQLTPYIIAISVCFESENMLWCDQEYDFNNMDFSPQPLTTELWTLYLKKLFYLIIVNVKWQYTWPYFLQEDTVHLIRNDKMSQYTLTFD